MMKTFDLGREQVPWSHDRRGHNFNELNRFNVDKQEADFIVESHPLAKLVKNRFSATDWRKWQSWKPQ